MRNYNKKLVYFYKKAQGGLIVKNKKYVVYMLIVLSIFSLSMGGYCCFTNNSGCQDNDQDNNQPTCNINIPCPTEEQTTESIQPTETPVITAQPVNTIKPNGNSKTLPKTGENNNYIIMGIAVFCLILGGVILVKMKLKSAK